MSDTIEDIFFPRAPNVCRRALAIWELLCDFKADCDALDPGELSRRCETLVEFVTHTQARQHVVNSEEYDSPLLPEEPDAPLIEPRAERINRMRHAVFNHATPPPPPKRGRTKKPKQVRR